MRATDGSVRLPGHVGPRGRRQARRAHLARRRGPAAADPAHAQGRPRRHARPDGHRRAGLRGRSAGRSCSGTWRSTPRPTRATIRLGATTTTDDAEGEVVTTTDASGVADEAIAAGIAALTGPILQVPSAVSAIKVDGRRAYARVRAGEQVVLPAAAGHGLDLHARSPGAAPTSTSRSSARPGRTCGHWPATWAPRWVSAGT